jgi:4-alpha-glucanotransferase
MSAPEKVRSPFAHRSSGLLLHPTSLPGPHGVGDLGPEAHAFAEFLASAGQRWWQMLPVGPPGAGFSPYDTPSSFAGSPLLVSLELLRRDGLLKKSELDPPRRLARAGRADYEQASRFRWSRLEKAFERFQAKASPDQRARFERFVRKNRSWLEPYSQFDALKRELKGHAWFEWKEDLRDRKPEAVKQLRRELVEAIRFCQFVQFKFDEQFTELRHRCAEHQIRLLGDVPMFVAHDGADVWANRDLFFLDERGERTVVAGVPPDYFSEDGQLWGNPLYRWDVLKRQGYAWWVARLKHTLSRFDAVRLDHFIAFYRYWEIPAGSLTAKHGRFVKSPGRDFLKVMRRELSGLPFVAEDLGIVTPEVTALRDDFALPGMRVLQFGFSKGAETYQPHRYNPNVVAYTGTHDNDTLVGWFETEGSRPLERQALRTEHKRARAYAGMAPDSTDPWPLMRTLLMSVANTTIFPLQDLLRLGTRARMNVPGTPFGNWRWRLKHSDLKPAVARRMRELVDLYERNQFRKP